MKPEPRAVSPGRAAWRAAAAYGVDMSQIEVRAGMHTGEVELKDDEVRGIAVSIASRVTDLAEGGQALVTRTVKDLIAGSGVQFDDFGSHKLKGVPEDWQIYAVSN